jgi:UDP-glucuronate 4-epimerase
MDWAGKRVLVTGAAGFIGHHVSRRLLDAGAEVLGLDNFTPYYDPALKEARAAALAGRAGFTLVRAGLEDAESLGAAWTGFRPEVVVHLAAQAGVRYSLEAPGSYVVSNLVGTANLLEAARACPPEHLLFASTSSVYGGNDASPFRETDRAAAPLSLYAATKGGGELLAHSYAHLFALPVTAFRFFTVYGPWGRPDMAYFKFAQAILDGAPIEVYNGGDMARDFTYIDDLFDSVLDLAALPPPAPGEDRDAAIPGDSLSPVAPFRVVNIAGGQSVGLMDFIAALEAALGRKAEIVFQPVQAGDMKATAASPDLLRALTGHVPTTGVAEGLARFADWYRQWRAGGG